MKRTYFLRTFLIFLAVGVIVDNLIGDEQQPIKNLPVGAFEFVEEAVLPGTEEEIFDALTGDISGWWDHTFSGNPARFYIEPKPGGGFLEIFDDQGNGVLHGTVIYAQRPVKLRFEGPLGLSGHALKLVCTYDLAIQGSDSTRLTVTVRASGEMQENWPQIIRNVWKHFVFERFVPFIIEGKHKGKTGNSKQ